MIDATTREGAYTLPAELRRPEGDFGVVARLPLKLPAWRAVCHYTAYQRHDPMRQARADQAIGGGANRVQGLRIERWSEAIRGGLYAIAQTGEDDWLVLLPIAGQEAMAWLAPFGDDVRLEVGTLGTDPVDAALPVLAWARRHSVYRAARDAWRLALGAVGASARLREGKPYPRIFEHLGWCSWEQHKRGIDEATIVEAIRGIHRSGLPVRFVLIDDGHLRGCGGEKMMDQHLAGLGPNADFPNGWGPIHAERRDDGVRWMGLWQNFNGYWNRIAPDNDLGEEINAHLAEVPAGGLLPGATLPDATAWYEAMLGYARHSGFDFVKVDQQAANLIGYRGTDNAVRAATCCSRAFERAAAARADGVINCMAHGPVNAFGTCLSAVTRCSEDYKLNEPWRAKAHLHNSYQNMLWLGPTVWGDHDMFHSADGFAGRMMAVSKAISGGPVYLSDDPGDFDAANVRPLCFDDGRLLRPLAPAVPLPRSVMLDPFEQDRPYVVAAPLPDAAAAVVAYNLTEPTRPVRGEIGIDDHRDAAGLLDPERQPRPDADEGLVLYDWYRGAAVELDGPWAFELGDFADLLALLCPIRSGWAVIGRCDKFLSPAGVELLDATDEQLALRSPEPGPVTVWRRGALRTVELPRGVSRIPA
ncbi:MAG: Sip1-related alpha-galactosidase [Planctomycetota bacterium]